MNLSMAVNNITFGAKIGNIPNINRIAGNNLPLSNIKLNGYNAFIGGDVYTPSGKIKQDLLFLGKKLVAINDFNENEINDKINYVILQDETVAPAIVDEHIHGGYGISFHDSNESQIRELLKKLAERGIGGVVATTLPDSIENIRKQIDILHNIIHNQKEGEARLFGIHLEGPFINPLKKGIHEKEKILVPTVENYESMNPKDISIVTLAPELDKGYNLTKYLQEHGVIVSAGHSIALAKQLADAGIKQVTHLFNAMSPFHHRVPTITNEGLVNPDVVAEMISDGVHLAPQTMNLVMSIKTSDKLVLVSDALPYAGLKEDFYMNGVRIHIDENGVAKNADGTIAGSMKFLHDVAKKLIDTTNATFTDFIRCACENPAKNIGVGDKFVLKEGSEPIFSVWDNKTTTVEKTFINYN
ncbi:MAG: N-acetylglucosamine-6-phosphate deacetylase [bacterium]|nr:N-acetylglucosamine-6-phosphate deacetylase [bacterium]